MIKISSFNHSALLTLIVVDIKRRLDISTMLRPQSHPILCHLALKMYLKKKLYMRVTKPKP